MNKKGITIIELLISITLTSIIVLLLIRVFFSFNNLNNKENYAYEDEISRTEIIKEIESDFLKDKLNGLEITEYANNIKVTFLFESTKKDLEITADNITYDKTKHSLSSKNATYSLCIDYKYTKLENDYYLISLIIPVLINNENTTENDDLILTFLNKELDTTSYPIDFSCTKK